MTIVRVLVMHTLVSDYESVVVSVRPVVPRGSRMLDIPWVEAASIPLALGECMDNFYLAPVA